MTSLIDTSFFVALSFPRDRYHEAAKLAKRTMTGTRIVSAPVLSELFYVINARINYEAAQKAFQLASSPPFQLESLTKSDLERMREIMQKYASSRFDFTDAAIMAQAERLGVEQIYTFDRRDFVQFRPLHCDVLTLFP